MRVRRGGGTGVSGLWGTGGHSEPYACSSLLHFAFLLLILSILLRTRGKGSHKFTQAAGMHLFISSTACIINRKAKNRPIFCCLIIRSRLIIHLVVPLSPTASFFFSLAPDILSCLIEAGANPERTDGDGRTPLAMACICNQTDIARYLVQVAKVDVECDDNCGNTPLLHAINSGLSLNLDLVRILLEAGADPNHFNRHGHSALFTVVRRASEHSLEGIMAVEQLIGHGCNLNDSDSGEPVIHLTISRGQDRITEALIRSGADVNVRNERGFSPLHRVAREEKVDLVNLLIAAGADVHLPKHFYTDEAGHMRDIKCPEIRRIFSMHTRKVPSLKHLARVSIRHWLERRADSVIKQLPFPLPLKRYLLLVDS